MNDEEKLDLGRQIGRLEGSFNEFLRAHAEDARRRDEWRIGIENKVDDLAEQIRPVVNDHHAVMTLAKWAGKLGASVALLFSIVKGWFAFHDHFRP